MTLCDSGRLKIIPFKRHFKEAEQDKGLKALAEEDNLSGIFNWCLEGYNVFRRERLESPIAVLDIQEYRNDSDRIGQFIEAWQEGMPLKCGLPQLINGTQTGAKGTTTMQRTWKNFKKLLKRILHCARQAQGRWREDILKGGRFPLAANSVRMRMDRKNYTAKSDFKAVMMDRVRIWCRACFRTCRWDLQGAFKVWGREWQVKTVFSLLFSLYFNVFTCHKFPSKKGNKRKRKEV